MSPEELFVKWNQKIPCDASYQDVKRVAEFFLGKENIRSGSRGSHQILIKGPITHIAARFRDGGHSELAWLENDSLLISTVRGRYVKKIWVKHLVSLINFKQRYERHLNERRDS